MLVGIYVFQPMNETLCSSKSDQSTGLLGLLPGTVTLMMMMMITFTQIHHEIMDSLINGSLLIDLLVIGELINRKTANINVKKLQFIHMSTATDLRTSKTAKI